MIEGLGVGPRIATSPVESPTLLPLSEDGDGELDAPSSERTVEDDTGTGDDGCNEADADEPDANDDQPDAFDEDHSDAPSDGRSVVGDDNQPEVDPG